jgi:hypothetical protein
VAGSCEYGDESSGSDATELVSSHSCYIKVRLVVNTIMKVLLPQGIIGQQF